MKYLVAYPVLHVTDMDDDEVLEEPDVRGICACDDTRQVAACVAKALRDRTGWAVFELTDSSTGTRTAIVRRSVKMLFDGKRLYDVEIVR